MSAQKQRIDRRHEHVGQHAFGSEIRACDRQRPRLE